MQPDMEHLPVLYHECLSALKIRPDGIYLDCTFGRGGHSQGILNLLGDKGRLLAIDRDEEAIKSAVAQELLKDSRFSLYQARFSDLQQIVDEHLEGEKLDGILMDLGVSSPQLDNPERGFSFMQDGPLDMRMDANTGISAAEWLQQVEEKQLVKVLFEYGEERFARRIAKAIIDERAEHSLETTRQLAQLIENAVPFREKHKHPATRSFQAIRIEINQELEEVKKGLQQAVNCLASNGRLAVISFHSLEDRIVKRFFRQESGRKNNPGRLPVLEKDIQQGCLKTIGKAIKAGPEELARNPRARSAVLRIAEKK